MRLPASRVLYASLFFVLLITLVVVSKPSGVFTPDGHVRSFGVGPEGTLFPLGVITTAAATVSMYLFTFIDAFFS